MRRHIACLVVLLVGCSDDSHARVELDENRSEVPLVMFHRYPGYPLPNRASICGPVVAVWPDRRIVRVASEEAIGKDYVEGTLTSVQLEGLLRFMETNDGLLNLHDGYIIVDAASETLGIRLKDGCIMYGETVGDFAQIRHNPDMAALRQYLMSLEIPQPQATQSPWSFPPPDWYR